MSGETYEYAERESGNAKTKKAKNSKNTLNKIKTVFLFFIIFIGLKILNPFFILEEGKTAIVTQFGKVAKTETEPGLHFKIPLIHKVRKYTVKLLRVDGDPQKIPTAEKQYIEVDTTSRWRITDIKKFYQSLVTYEGAFSRLSDIIDSSVRDIITVSSIYDVVRNSNIINESAGKENLSAETKELYGKDIEETDEDIKNLTNEKISYPKIKKGRETLAEEILAKANSQVGEFGVEIIDVIFKQIKYSNELQNSVFNRMIKDRNQIAQTYRSTGEGKKAEWLGKLENERRTILSGGYSESEKIKGAADAKATAIYANAYKKSPEFYSFWKSIEIYKKSLPKTEKILSTDMEYFKYLYSH